MNRIYVTFFFIEKDFESKGRKRKTKRKVESIKVMIYMWKIYIKYKIGKFVTIKANM